VRILTIFIDMIRANRLSLFNDKIKEDTPLDKIFKELGGTIYNNCFTPAPDTSRSMACFYTGQKPFKNGCNSRLKWPRFFLNNNLLTIFDLFIEKGYKINCFSNPNERETGLFPEKITDMDIHNKDFNLNKYLNSIKLEKDHFLFISLPDFHWSFDDNGYSEFGERKAYKDVSKSFSIIFENFNKDDFDHIFIFSDHGFKFMSEVIYQKIFNKKYLLLNEDRTNIIMLHRERNNNKIIYNNKLCSIEDMLATFGDILNINISNGISLFSDSERDYILAEDHYNFSISVNQNIEIWALLTKDIIYIRTLENGYLIDRITKKIKENIIIEEMDFILKQNSSFGIYMDEYEKIFKYKKFILKQTLFMHGGQRIVKSKIFKYLMFFWDYVKFTLKGKK